MTLDRRTMLKTLAAGASAVLASPSAAGASSDPVEAPEDAVGLLFDPTLCIGCQACVHACREVNGVPYDEDDELHYNNTDLSANCRNIIKLYRDDSGEESEVRETYMKMQCMHCIDPACASACMLGSFQKRIGGAITWDPSKCVGCRYCQIACPFGVPQFDWDSATPTLVKCELCSHRLEDGLEPGCTDVCPREAVIFGRRDDLLAEAHRRIEAEPEKYQDHVYGEFEAGGTQCLYLAPHDISFQDMGLPDLENRGVPRLPETLQHTIYKGFAAPTLLYAVLGVTIWKNRKENEKADEARQAKSGTTSYAERNDGGAP